MVQEKKTVSVLIYLPNFYSLCLNYPLRPKSLPSPSPSPLSLS